MLVDIIAGARPNFMKISPIIRAIKARIENGSALRYRLIHTGQHYDREMSGAFFEQLGIPDPDLNLAVGPGTQAVQTAGIMIAYERVLLEQRSDLCLVVGDVTSTMACAIVAQKLHVPVAHVEAGIRSGDWKMPEEINRIVTDSISNLFLTTSESAGTALLASGTKPTAIHFVGNTMIDTLMVNLNKLSAPEFFFENGLERGRYFVLTLHRPSNVDDNARTLDLLRIISDEAGETPIVFPVHPRTAKMLEGAVWQLPNIVAVPPQAYHQFNWLVRESKGVITDSGGISEETTFLGIPCITLRDSTERPETIDIGTNVLIGNDMDLLSRSIRDVKQGKWKSGAIPEKWDGHAGERIAEILDTMAKTLADAKQQDTNDISN